MPIRSIADLRKQVGPDWNDVSDEDLISSYAQSIKADPAAVAYNLGFGLEEGGKNSKRLSASVDRYQAGLYGFAEEASKAVGLDSASDWLGQRRRANELRADTDSVRAQQLGAVDSWKDVHGASDFADYAVGLGIQSLPYAAEAVIGGMLTRGAMPAARAALNTARLAGDVAGVAKAKRALDIGSTVGATAASYPSAVGDILSNQREQSGGTTDAASAFALGVPYAVANATLGVEGTVSRGSLFRNSVNLLDDIKGLKGGVARMAATGAVTGIKEGASETFQEGMNQLGRMAVDPNEQFFSDAAQERFKESFIGGSLLGGGTSSFLGGWRRSVPANDIQQAFQQTPAGTTPAPDVTQTTPAQTVAPISPPAAPAVQGGTTEIAQATQAAQTQDVAAQQAMAQQSAREQAFDLTGATTTNDNGGMLSIYGQTVVGPQINTFGMALSTKLSGLSPVQKELVKAVSEANAMTDGTLVKFKFNANNPMGSAEAVIKALDKTLTSFQIGHVTDVAQAAGILNKLSESAKGNQLEQIDAIHVALTGENTSGWAAAQQPKAKKGAKDERLQLQQQNPSGVGAVREQSQAGAAPQGQPGAVQPGGVQPVGAGGLAQGSAGQQAGQLPGEGIRPSPGAEPVANDGGIVGQAPQVIQGVQDGQIAPAQASSGQTEQAGQIGSPSQIAGDGQLDDHTAGVSQSAAPADERLESAEQALDVVPALLRNVLGMVFRSPKKIEFLATFMRKQSDVSYAELGARLGYDEDTIKQYQKLLRVGSYVVGPNGKKKFVESKTGTYQVVLDHQEKFAAAVQYQAQQMGVDANELLAALNDVQEAYESKQANAGTAEENDLIGQGFIIQERKEREDADGNKTGKIDRTNVTDLNEEGNTAEALNNRYLQLVNELEQAEDSGDDARADQLRNELAAVASLAAQEDKKARQKVRQDAGKTGTAETKESEDAVQEPSAEGVDVRKSAADGQAVGEGNSQGQATPKSKGKAVVVKKAKPKQEDVVAPIKTAAEQYADLTKGFPAPAFGELAKDQNEQITDLAGRGQLNLAAINRILSAKSQTVASRSRQFVDLDGAATEVEGIDTVQGQLEAAGIPNAADFVSDWEVVEDNSKNAPHGELRVEQGRYVGRLNAAKLDNPAYAAETALHEIGHAVDMALHGGVYSGQPEMSVAVKDGKVTPVGAVAREMYALYQKDENWREYLEYPFDTGIHTDLDNSTKVESELFAQVFAVYANPKGRLAIEKAAPKTAAFMKEVFDDIRSTKALQIQKAETAAARALSFRNRGAGSGNQSAPQVSGQPARPGAGESLASRGTRLSVDQVIGKLPKPLREAVRETTTNQWAGLRKAGLYLAITEDIVNAAKKYMKSAGDYLKAQYAQQAERLTHELEVEKLLNRFDKLPKSLQGTGDGSVNRLIFDMVRQGKWGFVPAWASDKAKADPAMLKRYMALQEKSPEAAKLVRDVLEHGYRSMMAKQAAVIDTAERLFKDREDAAKGDQTELDAVRLDRKAFEAKFEKLLKLKTDKPYAYMGRYGDYVAVAKSAEFVEKQELLRDGDSAAKAAAQKWLKEHESDPDHYYVSFAETQGAADKIAADLKAIGGYADIYAAEKLDSSAYVGGDDLFLGLKRLENMFTRKVKDEAIADDLAKGMRKLLTDLYLTSVAESSAHTSSMDKRNIAGASEDMMRNLATRGRADAHFLAALKHGTEVTDAIDRMIDEAGANRTQATPLLNELLKRQSKSLEYKLPSTLAQNMSQLSTVYYLSTSPAFYLQQMLQTSVLSLPYMAGEMGYFRAAREIRKAYGDIAGVVKSLGVNDHVDFANAPKDVQKMLKALVGMGKIDIGIDADAKSRTSDQGVMSKVMRKLQGVNTRIETINRATAAIAAYRAYLQKHGADKTEAATQYAADVVSNTHGSYDGFNTPRALSSDFGRVVGQFKRFQIIQLSMLGKLIHTAFKGASKEEQLVAMKSLGFITGHMAVLGGALGVPFVSQLGKLVVLPLAQMLGVADKDDPDDLETRLRKAIGNETVSDLLLRGVPAAVGLESLGKKLAMENVASLLPFTDIDLADRDALTKVYVSLLGPTAALSLKMADGLGMMRKGEYYKGLELMLPNGVSNVMKGARFLNSGVTMRNGDSVMGSEDIGMLDAAFQLFGLPTNTISDRQRDQGVVAEADKFYEERAAQVKRDFLRASKDGDTEDMRDAREAWLKLQDARARNGYTRQPLSTLFRAPAQQLKRERGVVGGVETTKANRRYVEETTSN